MMSEQVVREKMKEYQSKSDNATMKGKFAEAIIYSARIDTLLMVLEEVGG